MSCIVTEKKGGYINAGLPKKKDIGICFLIDTRDMINSTQNIEVS